ncbi:DNA ligase [Thauera chlorobenzoica]|nr:DNA ligase [Thauera chlorobenzoica]
MLNRSILRFLLGLLLAGAGAACGSTGGDFPAPPAMLAERYHDGIDPADYWVSEKLDGVRAHWNGSRLRLRSGQPVAAPGWFVAALPAVVLDGELWMGRRSFDRLSGLIRRNAPDDPGWREVRYMVFELPGAEGDFSTRVQQLRELAERAAVPWLQAVPQTRVADRRALQRRFEEVVRGGGEGLMLHRASARWIPGRSSALLKLTPWHDAEARVLAHLPGKGRLHGMTGSLLVETPDGRRFRLGSGLSDALRRSPPPPGTLVTYRYRELTPAGLPRFPRYLRMRDLP